MGDPARKSLREQAEEYLKLGFLPIPLSAQTKRPVKAHIPVLRSDMSFGPPQWVRSNAAAFGDQWDSKPYDIGILLDENSMNKRVPFVIDCDSVELFRLLEKKFPEFVETCGLATTRQGFHLWSWRSEYADQNAIYDNFKINIGVDHHGDVKTVTKSKREYVDAKRQTRTHTTPGNIAVFPSANKKWVRLPNLDGPEVDDLVVDWLKELSLSKSKRGRGPPRVRVEASLEDALEVIVKDCGPWTPTAERDLDCLRAMGFSVDSGSVKPCGCSGSRPRTGMVREAAATAPCREREDSGREELRTPVQSRQAGGGDGGERKGEHQGGDRAGWPQHGALL